MPLSLPRGTRIVAATHNPGKAAELAALLEGRFEVVTAGSARPNVVAVVTAVVRSPRA